MVYGLMKVERVKRRVKEPTRTKARPYTSKMTESEDDRAGRRAKQGIGIRLFGRGGGDVGLLGGV
jgi:hypothetical protein